MSKTRHEAELNSERRYIAFLYERLDAERAAAAQRLRDTLRDTEATGMQARWQRDVTAAALTERVGRLQVADSGLCFGRLEDAAGGRVYVGRLGLLDEQRDYEPLLTDWRAPTARPFYCATGANPEGVAVRRHFHTRGRQVDGFHDEVLDLAAADPRRAAEGATDRGDAALLAALNAPRAAAMRDIVATIQAEQDEIIRLGEAGVVVVEGGPGTGKTAVAMHRVGYLLYTHRERLSRRGVLVIGPNHGFLEYIGGVLPSLGETDVVFATPGDLLPGLRATAEDAPATRAVKGALTMAGVLAAAVADRQELPAAPIVLALPGGPVTVDAEVVAVARERARAAGVPHNRARPAFRDALVAALVDRTEREAAMLAAELASELTPALVAELAADDAANTAGESDRLFTAALAGDLRADLAGSPELAAAADRLWPPLTPQRLLTDLFASRERLAVAVGTLEAPEVAALHRPSGAPWTVSDVPLLDEAAELLGPLETGTAQAAARRDEEEFARGVLEIMELDEEELDDGQVLAAGDVLDAGRLSQRHADRDTRSLAERAAADREWRYGHVVVDEAQELSDMDWRVLMRRCPHRSFTIVGDLAQRQSPAGARSWAAALDRYVPGRWRYRRLSVNYRTTAEIMAAAAGALALVDPTLRPPDSIRSGGPRPWSRQVPAAALPAAVAQAVRTEQAHVGEGTVGVIAPDDLALPGALTPRAAKGLEFDAVVVVEPHRILTAGPHGAADLYVSLTRATQRLGILHTAPLPAALLVTHSYDP